MSDRLPLLRRIHGIDPRWLDVFLALGAVVLIALTLKAQNDPQYKDMPLWIAVILSASGLTLLLRRSRPLLGFLIAAAPVLVFTLLDYDVDAAPVVLLISMYAVGAYADRVQSLIGWVTAMAIIGIIWVVGPPGFDSASGLLNTAMFTAAWMFGQSMRNRRRYLASLEERAALLEADRERRAQQAVADERRRIAQELHDVVAHAMSVIAVQAGVGAHVIDTNPDQARKSLAAIEATSREALQEMRRMLGVLREEGDARGLLTSGPKQEDVDALIRNVEAAGVSVRLQFAGDVNKNIPASVRLNGFRVLQEALTNVVKHAGKASVVVTVGRNPGLAWVEIVDDGRGLASAQSEDGTGAGIAGMRERVALFGGRLETGPRPGGGFRVAAYFPFDSDDAAREEAPAQVTSP